jgi:putative MATE family efflux protein
MQRRGPAFDDRVPVWRTMLVFLIPLMLSNVLQSASATLNSIYLGRLIGVGALAAASSFFPIVYFLTAFFIGIASGASVLVGQAYGAKDDAKLKAVAGTTVTVSLITGIAAGAIGAIFCPQLLGMLGTPHDVFPDAVAYARTTFCALPLFFVYLAYTTFVRGTGDSRTPLLALIVSTACVLLLTPAFVLGWMGLPHLGIISAAAANIIGNAIALTFLLVALWKEKNPLAFGNIIDSLRIDLTLLRVLVRIGVPTGVQMVTVSLSEIAVIALVNRYGSAATAAYGAVNQIASYAQFPALSIGIASSIFGAQSIGAGRSDRMGVIARAGLGLNVIVTGLIIAVVYVFNDAILHLFVNDRGVTDLAHSLLAITLWSYIVFGATSVLSGLMRSSGTVLWPTAFSIIAIWAVEVPVAYTLALHFGLGLKGIWIAYPVAFLANLIMQSLYYRFVWRKRRLTTLIGPEGAPEAT